MYVLTDIYVSTEGMDKTMKGQMSPPAHLVLPSDGFFKSIAVTHSHGTPQSRQALGAQVHPFPHGGALASKRLQ